MMHHNFTPGIILPDRRTAQLYPGIMLRNSGGPSQMIHHNFTPGTILPDRRTTPNDQAQRTDWGFLSDYQVPYP